MIRCLVVDDEPLARQLMEQYIAEIQGLECVATAKSALEAFAVLHEQEVDLLLLDINMPGITGLNFLRSLNNPPAVIFTTAYAEYAVEAFELEAVDYLLKPITPERFLKAVQKITSKKSNVPVKVTPDATSLFLKVDKRLVKVDFADILYAEALGDYVKVITANDGVLITHNTIAKIEALLPTSLFVRVHRSFIVAKAHIRFIEGNFVKIRETDVPIGATYRDGLISSI